MWETIKTILQKHGGTCIIIEEGRPTYVVVGFQDFQKSLETKEKLFSEKTSNNISEQELLEKINQEITNWKIAQTEEQAAQALEKDAESEVKIEDLPL